jgi:hypothetical protein
MSAPNGTWKINANGVTGALTLSGPLSGSGPITGTVFGDPLGGVWDDDSQVLSFSRATHNGPDCQFEVYTGTLLPKYSTPDESMPGGGQVPPMITGDFGTVSAAAQFGVFGRFGWFATL